jgi:hypothetical protein
MKYKHIRKTLKDRDRAKKAKEQFSAINNGSDVCHIFYDLTVTNYNSNTLTPIPTAFSQNRANPFLDRPEDYNVAISFMKLDSNSFPLQAVLPEIGSSSTLGFFPTVFKGIVRGKTIFNQPYPVPFTVNWIPADTTIPVPSSPITNQNYNSPYFYNYSYNHFLNLLNKAIADAVTVINTTQGTSWKTPYFSYNPVNKRFSYNTDFNSFSEGTGNFVYFNEALYSLFDGLPYVFESTPIDPGLGTYRNLYRLFSNLNPGYTNTFVQYTNLSNAPLVPAYNAVQMEQNYTSVNIWNPVISVVFISRNLNVINTLEARPFIFGYNPNPPTNNANVSNILFEVPITKIGNPTIYYEPTAEFSLTNLLGIVETGELQIDVFWKDTFGNLNKFDLEIGSTLIMRLLFRKKAFNY